jgi:hypothetical protein
MTMGIHRLTAKDLLKAVGVGVATAVLLSAVMVPAMRLGVSPLPKPLGLAFAETVLGRPLPLPVGLLFHVAYVTVWSVAFVAVFRDRLSLRRALLLGAVLWLAVLVVFFPLVGWGVFGLGVGPKLIVASLVPHLLFGIVLWGLCRLAFRPQEVDGTQL